MFLSRSVCLSFTLPFSSQFYLYSDLELRPCGQRQGNHSLRLRQLRSLALWQSSLLSQSPCLNDHNFTKEELKSVGELSKVCSQVVLKCFFLARIGRPDILWSVNKLARSATKWTQAKWTQACNRRLARLISYIHHTNGFREYCHVGNTA